MLSAILLFLDSFVLSFLFYFISDGEIAPCKLSLSLNKSKFCYQSKAIIIDL